MTNGSSSELKTFQVEAGFSDANFSVGCNVRGSNFGTITVSNKNGFSLKNYCFKIECSAFHGVDTIYVNVFWSGSRRVSILDSAGKVLVNNAQGGVASFKAVNGGVYYVVCNQQAASWGWAKCTELPITGIGFGGNCKQGTDGSVTITISANEEFYAASASNLPPTVGITFHFQGLPTIMKDLSMNVVIGQEDVGKEKEFVIPFPANSNGARWSCEVQLNGVIQLFTNSFAGQTDIFEEAKLYVRFNGELYGETDLLGTPVSNKPVEGGNFVAPAGDISDAAYVIKVKVKDIPQNNGFEVKANMILWYESGFASLCS